MSLVKTMSPAHPLLNQIRSQSILETELQCPPKDEMFNLLVGCLLFATMMYCNKTDAHAAVSSEDKYDASLRKACCFGPTNGLSIQ